MLTKRFINDLELNDLDLESLIIISVQLDAIIEGFKKKNLEVPEYLCEKTTLLNNEIEIRIKAEKLRKLKILKIKREGLSTREELRAKVAAEIQALEKEL